MGPLVLWHWVLVWQLLGKPRSPGTGARSMVSRQAPSTDKNGEDSKPPCGLPVPESLWKVSPKWLCQRLCSQGVSVASSLSGASLRSTRGSDQSPFKLLLPLCAGTEILGVFYKSRVSVGFCSFVLFVFIYLLAAPGLSCVRRTLNCGMWNPAPDQGSTLAFPGSMES